MTIRMEVIGDATLYCGSMEDVLPTLGRFDACVTDPPYGLGDKLRIGGFKEWPLMQAEMKCAVWDDATASGLYAAIESARHSIVWGGNYYELPPMRGWLVWDKVVRKFSSGHVELAWTTLDQPTRAFNYAHGELASEGKLHPTQKPLPLMEWCLSHLPADVVTVVDPFAGSGTTGVACVKRGLTFTGIEREPRYFEIALRRIEQAYAQPRLALEPPPKPVQTDMLGGAA
jgi:site-specific DNA-methyltransferase (adenine-specific)